MGFLDDLLGNTSADAAKAAAADTYGKQNAATAGIRSAGQTYASKFGDLSKSFDPWAATGSGANDAVARLIADPSSVRSLPGYQTGMQEGVNAIDHSALSNGNLFSGKTGKGLTKFGESYFDKSYGDQLARLLGVSQQGLDATSRGVATEGTGLTGELGANTSAYAGDMTAAGTIGQGDIAGANAKTQGIQNLLNVGGFLGGSALSGGFKMPKFNSFFGGGSPSGYGT